MNLLKCDEIKESLIDYLEFELPLSSREAFHDHLTHCSQCRKLHDELQSVMVEVKDIDVPEPQPGYWEALPHRVLAQVKDNKQQDSQLTPDAKTDRFDLPERTQLSSTAVTQDDNVLLFSRKRDRKTVDVPEKVDVDMSSNQDINNSHVPRSDEPFDSEVETDKQQRKISWPKIALPIAAAILVAVGTMFKTDEIERSKNLFYSPTQFQSSIDSEKSIASLAQTVAPVSQSTTGFGFANQHTILNTFSLGSMFSETIAYTASEEHALLNTHLQLLKTALTRGSISAENAVESINNIQDTLAADAGDIDMPSIGLKLAELFDSYAMQVKERNHGHFVLLYAGAWSFDYSLAVLAKDFQRVKQKDRIEYFKSELHKLNAPIGVANSFDVILKNIERKDLGEAGYTVLLKEIDNIRSLLG